MKKEKQFFLDEFSWRREERSYGKPTTNKVVKG
jgi:hypothetical protein